jgi:hypothetical protein
MRWYGRLRLLDVRTHDTLRAPAFVVHPLPARAFDRPT